MFRFSLFISLFIAFINDSSGQCSNILPVEAVRNGDFEAGYLTGSDTIHDFIQDSDFDFRSSFIFIGEYDSLAPCNYQFGGYYAVVRAEDYTCSSTNLTDKPYWSAFYSDSSFTDHSYGKGGNGFCLVNDLYNTSVQGVDKFNIWEQKVDVIQNETYWLSTWVAKYGDSTQSSPGISIIVLPLINGIVDSLNIDTLVNPVTISDINWNQQKGIWTPNATYDEVILRIIHTNFVSGFNGLDIRIDDISFSNSSQNYNGYPTVKADFNPCLTTSNFGIILTNLNNNKTEIGNGAIHWYKDSTQIIQNQFMNDSIATFTEEGTYRYCIEKNGSTINGNVNVLANMEVSIEDEFLCENTETTVKIEYNKDEINGINWETKYGNHSNIDSILIDNADSIYVYSTPKGNFDCAFKDTFIVENYNEISTDTIFYCYNDSFLIPFSSANGYVSFDEDGHDFLGGGSQLKIDVSQIPTSTKELFIRNVKRDYLGSASNIYLNTDSIYRKIGKMNVIVSENVLLKSFKVLQASPNGSGAVNINITGPVNYNIPLTLELDSLMTIEHAVYLPKGEYVFSTDVEIQTKPSTSFYSYFGGIVQIGDNDSANVFMIRMELETVEFFCESSSFPIKKYDYCVNSSELKNQNKLINGCLQEEFEVELVDSFGDLLNIGVRTIKWFGPLDYTTLIPHFNNQFTVEFSSPGGYRYEITNPLTNSKFNGFIEVSEGYELDFESQNICNYGASVDYTVLPYNPQAITGFNWTSTYNGSYQADYSVITETDTLTVEAVNIGNFSCEFKDTMFVIKSTLNLKDTIGFCSTDTAIIINSGDSSTIYTSDYTGLNSISIGAEYNLAYSGSGVPSPIYARKPQVKDIPNEFTFSDPNAVSTIFYSKAFALDFTKDVYLESYQIVVRQGLTWIDIRIGNSNPNIFSINATKDTTINIDCKILIPKGRCDIKTAGNINALSISQTYVDDSIYYLDSTFSIISGDHQFFMEKMKFSEVTNHCPSVKISFKKDDSSCLIISSISQLYSNLKIYPNPTNGTLNFNRVIQFGQLFNLQGKKVFEFKNKNRIDLSILSQGTYILKIGRTNTKLIITK